MAVLKKQVNGPAARENVAKFSKETSSVAQSIFLRTLVERVQKDSRKATLTDARHLTAVLHKYAFLRNVNKWEVLKRAT